MNSPKVDSTSAVGEAPTVSGDREDMDYMSHDELTRRLRNMGSALCVEAADRIDYLFAQEDLLETTQQQVERLEAQLADADAAFDLFCARAAGGHLSVLVDQLRADGAALQASHDRLMEALEWALHRISISLNCGSFYDKAADALAAAKALA